MEIYRTEEQQLDALRQWWKNNHKVILISVGLSLAVVFGYKFFQHHQNSDRDIASEKFNLLLKSHEENDLVTQKQKADELIKEYGSTSYATLAALMQAKSAVDEKKL